MALEILPPKLGVRENLVQTISIDNVNFINIPNFELNKAEKD